MKVGFSNSMGICYFPGVSMTSHQWHLRFEWNVFFFGSFPRKTKERVFTNLKINSFPKLGDPKFEKFPTQKRTKRCHNLIFFEESCKPYGVFRWSFRSTFCWMGFSLFTARPWAWESPLFACLGCVVVQPWVRQIPRIFRNRYGCFQK